jgi:hypothetical protein
LDNSKEHGAFNAPTFQPPSIKGFPGAKERGSQYQDQLVALWPENNMGI